MAEPAIAAPSGALGRLALARDILTVQDGMVRAAAGTQANRVRQARVFGQYRIKALRRALMNRPDSDPADEYLSLTSGPKKLASLLDAAADQPPVQRLQTALYALKIAGMLQNMLVTELTVGMVEKFDDAAIRDVYLRADAMQKAHGKPDDLIDANIAHGDFGEKIKASAQAAKAANGGTTRLRLLRLSSDVDPELAALIRLTRSEVEARNADFQAASAAYREIYKKKRRAETGEDDVSDEQLKAFNEALELAYKAQVEAYEAASKKAGEVNALNAKMHQIQKEDQKKSAEVFADAGRQALAAVLQASPVTEDEAEQWARAQDITKTALARLKVLKYPLADVRRDMAEYYRLVGGRIVRIQLNSKGDKRANATDIEAHGTGGVINMGSAFDKQTLWHELAHHLEDDPTAKIASGHFIARRSEDGKAHTLRKLTGNKGYSSNEIAYKDHFFNEYVGKIYRDGITEVFSMGVETFSDPVTLGKRIADDPQTLEFAAGYLKQPVNPLAKVMQSLRDSMVQITDDAAGGTKDVVAELTAELASTVQLIPDTDMEWLKGDMNWQVQASITNPVQLGRFERGEDKVKLLSGIVKNPETRRKSKGYLLCVPSRHASGAYGLRMTAQSFVGTMDQVKAAVAMYWKNGRVPYLSDLNNEADLRRALSQ